MVNGDVKTNESVGAILSVPATEPGMVAELDFSAENARGDKPSVRNMREKPVLEDHFARLKKRMRSHATSIF